MSDLDAIAIFVKVVEAGSFSEAARLLKMPKTTVSAKVAALEKRLGATLIQRTTRTLRVTDAGARYFQRCVVAVREVELAESELMAQQQVPSGVLRITAPVDAAHSILPPVMARYLDRYPEASIELVVTNGIVDLIAEGIDLAIRAGELKDSTLLARHFFDIGAGLWAAPAYLKANGAPATPKGLAQHQLVRHRATKTLVLERGGRQTTVPIQSRMTVDDFETVRAMALLGKGIGWMPRFLVNDDLAAGRLVPVLPAWQLASGGAFSFVYPGRHHASPTVKAFIEIAMAMVEGEARQKPKKERPGRS